MSQWFPLPGCKFIIFFYYCNLITVTSFSFCQQLQWSPVHLRRNIFHWHRSDPQHRFLWISGKIFLIDNLVGCTEILYNFLLDDVPRPRYAKNEMKIFLTEIILKKTLTPHLWFSWMADLTQNMLPVSSIGRHSLPSQQEPILPSTLL